MSFWDSHIYRSPTHPRFNMCNGTYRPDPSRDKKIALDPAESSAIDGGACWGRPRRMKLCGFIGLGDPIRTL
ncbi:hypothetical protein GCM10010302_39100 [Streptomyces polychromogenes]|uniref:Uncharacterized protein n=1 Tax=Streptomyces polychromogenes TaxID=67342 RepID=A0ABN0VGI7_9ACTN